MPKNSDISDWYLNRFYMLSNSRQMGLAPSPIAISEMIAVGTSLGTIGTLEEFIEVMQQLDYIYLSKIKVEGEVK